MFGLILTGAVAASLSAQGCTALQDTDIEYLTITSAEVVPQGPFQGTAPFGGPPADSVPLPAHCKLTLSLKPTEISDINAELWLPMEGWNGKYLAVGNGGWAGSIQGYGDMQEALRAGYATAGSDNGSAPNSTFALDGAERVVDFAYRALHLMTNSSKSLIESAYSQPAQFSYYKGCSTGGRQGLMAAQRFPADYDAIIAGAPANRHINMHIAQSYEQIFVNQNPEAAISAELAEQVNSTIRQQCDVLDEGFVSNPQQCAVDLAALQCEAGSTGSQCLTSAQMKTVEMYYGGVITEDNEVVFSGRPLSVPLNAITASGQAPISLVYDTIRVLGFEDMDYDWRNFDLDRDMPVITGKVGYIDAADPDLSEFRDNGGKLLVYHGWDDPGISARNAVDYYVSVLQETDSNPDDWYQLYMVPGMGHCSGGPGPHSFDTLSVIEDWREQGQTPASIMGSNPQSSLERPLCPYPEQAIYDGTGDLNAAENWSCM